MEAERGADLIVANDVGRSDMRLRRPGPTRLDLLRRDGAAEVVSRRSKREVAEKIWDAFLAVRAVGRRGTAPTTDPLPGEGEE
jgi:phosphopantothenoylcysteine synthetase/decarboxylase